MKRLLIIAVTLVPLTLCPATASAFSFKWKAVPTDGSRTGVTAPNAANVTEALGTFKGKTYIAPNGVKYKKKSATAKAARLMMDAQPEMAYVKEVVGYCPKGLSRRGPESLLGNWSIDCMMACAEKEFGKHMDIGVTNHGGIRIDMPQGDVLVDDLLSMFPFNNYLCCLELRGSDVLKLFDAMADHMQAVGGVKVTIKDHKVQELLVGGEPVDPDKVYNLVTIDFLLNGGDGIFAGADALSIEASTVKVYDAIIANVRELTAAGKYIEAEPDGRVVNLDPKRRPSDF